MRHKIKWILVSLDFRKWWSVLSLPTPTFVGDAVNNEIFDPSACYCTAATKEMVPATGEFMRTTTSLKLVIVKQIEERLKRHEKAFQTKSVSFFWAWTIVNLGLSGCIFRVFADPWLFFLCWTLRPSFIDVWINLIVSFTLMLQIPIENVIRHPKSTPKPLAKGIGPQGFKY